jgi:hypothetical protein
MANTSCTYTMNYLLQEKSLRDVFRIAWPSARAPARHRSKAFS